MSPTIKLPGWFALPPRINQNKPIAIIGGGLAGCATAYALKKKGIASTLIETEDTIAKAASGNPVGLLSPELSPDNNTTDQFLTQGFLYSRHVIETLCQQGYDIEHQWTGLLHLAVNNRLSQRFQRIVSQRHLPAKFTKLISQNQASDIAGIDLQYPALWLPMAGLVSPTDVCNTLIKASHCDCLLNTKISKINRHKSHWTLLDNNDNVILSADHVVIANANAAHQFLQTEKLPIKPVPGQLTLCQTNALSNNLKVPLSYQGYITPSINGQHIVGATYRHGKLGTEESAEDHQYNLTLLEKAAPQLSQSFNSTPLQSRVATRAITPDHLPLIGPTADFQTFNTQFAKLPHGKRACQDEMVSYLPGLFMNAGHGSKGLASSLLAGEIIASQITNTTYPVNQKIYQAIHPLRFWVRSLKRNSIVQH